MDPSLEAFLLSLDHFHHSPSRESASELLEILQSPDRLKGLKVHAKHNPHPDLRMGFIQDVQTLSESLVDWLRNDEEFGIPHDGIEKVRFWVEGKSS
ncbi:MAG: hypothetical protein S4CHLAM102_11210 [Chlamydiia bacterium]|nr:hypothetical protein [Chlamydiia bacterium]